MLLWAFSGLDSLTHAWGFLDTCHKAGRWFDGVTISRLAMVCQQRGLHLKEVELLHTYLAKGAIRPVMLNTCALRLAGTGDVEGSLKVLCAAASEGVFNGVSAKIWTACGGGKMPQVFGEATGEPSPSEPYSKELRLLQYVLANACGGDVNAVCAAVESFGELMLPGTNHWLKVAAGAKAEVLIRAAQSAPASGLVLEMGTYCGYSAARLAATLQAKTRKLDACFAPYCPQVVSLEVDTVHAAIAENLLAFAGCAHVVEVLTGHSEDVLPWLVSRMKTMKGGSLTVDMVFLDQRGSRYDADLSMLVRSASLSSGCIVVADNVLKPGAPLFLWAVSQSELYSTTIHSLQEFAMPGVEDWITVSRYHPGFARASSPPPHVWKLEWTAEQMRAKAHLPDHGGHGIDFAEWAAFSSELRRELCEVVLAGSSAKLIEVDMPTPDQQPKENKC
jgi:catechol O-methyltransferase